MAYNPLFFGTRANAPSRSLSTGYVNGTLTGILLTKPVSADATGKIAVTDVADENSVMRFVGITTETIPSAASGQVLSGGRLEAIGAQISGFGYGDAVYVGPSGTLINIKPDVGVAGFNSGDWVIFLGVVVKNEFNLGEKDIQLMIEIIGQL